MNFTIKQLLFTFAVVGVGLAPRLRDWGEFAENSRGWQRGAVHRRCARPQRSR
jgi:hypothetical protein